MIIKKLSYYSDSSIYFEKIKHLEWPIFLDSCFQKDKPQSEYARFDIVAANPFIKIRAKKGITTVSDKDGHYQHSKPSLDVLIDLMAKYPKPSNSMPFVGGAIGYCSYELNLKTTKNNAIDTMIIGIYDWAVIVDHFAKKSYIVSMLVDSKTEVFLPELVSMFDRDMKNIPQDFKIKISAENPLF